MPGAGHKEVEHVTQLWVSGKSRGVRLRYPIFRLSQGKEASLQDGKISVVAAKKCGAVGILWALQQVINAGVTNPKVFGTLDIGTIGDSRGQRNGIGTAG